MGFFHNTNPPKPKDQRLFHPGKLYMTQGVRDCATSIELGAFLTCHVHGEWGDLCDEDKSTNTTAIVTGDRILSKYMLQCGKPIYIITEADRSCTTILLTTEY